MLAIVADWRGLLEEAPRLWIVWNKRSVVSSAPKNPAVLLNHLSTHNRLVSPEFGEFAV